jgi:hypothetical protein
VIGDAEPFVGIRYSALAGRERLFHRKNRAVEKISPNAYFSCFLINFGYSFLSQNIFAMNLSASSFFSPPQNALHDHDRHRRQPA